MPPFCFLAHPSRFRRNLNTRPANPISTKEFQKMKERKNVNFGQNNDFYTYLTLPYKVHTNDPSQFILFRLLAFGL